jgi:hypothetical protein
LFLGLPYLALRWMVVTVEPPQIEKGRRR